MGLCFSKSKSPAPPPPSTKNTPKISDKPALPNQPITVPKSIPEKTQAISPPNKTRGLSPENKITNISSEEKKKVDAPPTPLRKIQNVGSRGEERVTSPVAEEFKPAVVRTSSCTKEEVDAILIQCGRLSRSSSGKGGTEIGGSSRIRYSGSKRSYDFDNEKKGEELEDDGGDRPACRPSPQRISGRERSGSRERDGSGRRVSRSPGRRSEVLNGSSASERARQPSKMVSVPAREKGRGVSPGTKRCASPRSKSPANGGGIRVLNENQGNSLSRSSSRKAEQSPYRRNPLAEIAENTLKGNQNGSSHSKGMVKAKDGDEVSRKGNLIQTQRTTEQKMAATEIVKAVKVDDVLTNCVRERLLSCGGKEEEGGVVAEIQSIVASVKQNSRTDTRTISSRRPSSRDLDNAGNPPSYTSLLLEDIQNYHQNLDFTLPACVSKACSILEAVADLNSTSSENKTSEAEKSSSRRGLSNREPFFESEIGVKDDLLEPSIHKYVTTGRGETEPQESAGSNSFAGQALSCSWEPNSVDSTDRYWTSKSMNGDNVSPVGHDYQDRESETRGRRSRNAAVTDNSSLLPQATMSTTKRRELLNRSESGLSAGRANSLPAVAAVASS